MTTKMVRRGFVALVLVVSGYTASQAATPAPAAPSGKPPGALDFNEVQDRIEKAMKGIVDAETQATRDAVASEIADAPRQAPAAKQTTASSAAAQTGTVVDSPSSTELLSLALDNDIIELGDANAVTVNVNPFAILSLARPVVLDKQSEYGKHETLRRFSGSVVLGGKGESFDRDGDGKADEALTAKRFSDSAVMELRYRFMGSRDRRDGSNFKEFDNATHQVALDYTRAVSNFWLEHVSEVIRDMAVSVPGSSDAYIDGKKFDEFLARPSIKEELRRSADLHGKLLEAATAALKKVDNRMIWTAVLGRTERKADLGPEKWHFAIRGALGAEGASTTHTVNFDAFITDSASGATKQKMFKTGYQASTLWLKGSRLSEEGITASGSLAVEYNRDVPNTKHDTIVKLNGKLEFPVRKGVTVPVSLTYANHRDLLGGAAIVAGHLGVDFDLSPLKKLK